MLRKFSLLFLMILFFVAWPSSLQAQRTGGRGAGGIIDVQVGYANGRPGPRDVHVRLEAAEGDKAVSVSSRYRRVVFISFAYPSWAFKK